MRDDDYVVNPVTACVFANDESRAAVFECENRDPYHAAHADSRCTMTVMSGLPGAGRDTWNCSESPIVSLDALRADPGGPVSGNLGRVIQAAQERARAHLRAPPGAVPEDETRALARKLKRPGWDEAHLVRSVSG